MRYLAELCVAWLNRTFSQALAMNLVIHSRSPNKRNCASVSTNFGSHPLRNVQPPLGGVPLVLPDFRSGLFGQGDPFILEFDQPGNLFWVVAVGRLLACET